jgi:putative OPT family oligopeptide transporter
MPLLGGVLGVCFLIQFRRYFVAERHGKLPFPEATATTEILVTGEKGGKSAGILLISLGIGLILDYLALALKAWRDIFTTELIPSLSLFTEDLKAIFTLNTSAAVMGLGYIIGVRYAAIICAGSLLSYWVLVPLFAQIGSQIQGGLFEGLPPIADLSAENIFFEYVRLIGIGGIFGAGVISILKMSPVMAQALRQVFKEISKLRSRGDSNESIKRTELDLSMTQVASILILTAAAIGVYFRFVVLAGHPDATLKTAVALALTLTIAGLFAAVSAWAIAIISITPVSGMTLTTLIIAAVVLGRFLGLSGPDGMLATLLVGGVVCTALSMTGSMVTLLKVGYWVGGTPRKVQLSLILGSVLASITVTAVMLLFAHTQGYVVSPEHPNPMPAPQANAMAAVVRSMMGTVEAPWFLYGLGAVIAVLVEMTGVSSLAFALGMYLPLELTSPILAGAVVAWIVRRSAGEDKVVEKARNDRGTLVASGLIAGGALAGVLQAITDVLQEWTGWQFSSFDNSGWAGNWLGLIAFVLLGVGVFLDARRARVERL